MFITSWKRHKITFTSGKETCRGWLYRPDLARSVPCIVMAHGFASTRDGRLSAYAERFASAGYAVLVFNYRHFGQSDGEPRQLLSLQRQIEDWHAAIDLARSTAFIHPLSIVLWGSSLSGGHVIEVAADDPHIRAVISLLPHVSGSSALRTGGWRQNAKVVAAALRDQCRAVAGFSPYYVRSHGELGTLAALPSPSDNPRLHWHFRERDEDQRVAARIYLRLMLYSPGRKAHLLNMPWLIQVARDDHISPPMPAIHAARRAPQAIALQYPFGHFDGWFEPAFRSLLHDQLAFLSSHLPGPQP